MAPFGPTIFQYFFSVLAFVSLAKTMFVLSFSLAGLISAFH
jgi:hypothetical protein